MIGRYLGLLAGLTCVLPGAGSSQGFDEFDVLDEGWISILYPKAFYTTRNQVTVGGFGTYILPNSFEYLGPASYRAALAADAQLSTTGSWFLKLRAIAPNEFAGWRVHATLNGERQARENYFGIGNATTFDGDNVTGAQPQYYHVDHIRYSLRAEAQRTLTGPLRVLVGFDAARWRLTAHDDGPSVFANDLVAGLDAPTSFSTDVSARAGLVVDTRDNEIAPENGLFLYAIAAGSVLGDESYGRFTVSTAGYARLSDKWSLAGRVLSQTMTGSPRVGMFYVTDGVERTFTGLGGKGTHRGLYDNRFLDADQLLINLENRFVVLDIDGIAKLTTLWFFDVGRVFPQGGFELTTADMALGGGTGLILQIGQWGLAGGTIGVGPDGATASFHNRWSF